MKQLPLWCLVTALLGTNAHAADANDKPRYRLAAGKGYSVCEAYLKNLNAFPVTDPPMVCEQKIHPTHPEFSKPKWEPMDIKTSLPIIFQISMYAPPYSEALVELKQQGLFLNGHALPIASGMQLSAEIVQGKRTVLEYLLSPVQRVVSEAGMER